MKEALVFVLTAGLTCLALTSPASASEPTHDDIETPHAAATVNRLNAGNHPELKAFPPAKDGMERFVIVLPHKERGEDDAFKVEIVAGKSMLTDGVNQMRLGTTVEPRPLKGWGYTYYEVTGTDVAMSTMMAPPEGTPRVKRFVPGTSLQIRYNSRLPIVVYAPKGYEVRYRIWEASPVFERADKG